MLRIYTIGHSTHPIERFIEILHEHDVTYLADVRSFPSSRRWPQFNRESLGAALEETAIAYRWLEALGGRRRNLDPDSPNQAWEHPAFRSYADYALTESFRAGLESLEEAASQRNVAIMCSEGLWWRCHRRIVADYLVASGYRVLHIMPNGATVEHKLTDFAVVINSKCIVYPAAPPENQSPSGVRA